MTKPLTDAELEEIRVVGVYDCKIPQVASRLLATIDVLKAENEVSVSRLQQAIREEQASGQQDRRMFHEADKCVASLKADLDEVLDELLQSYYTARHCREDDALMISWRERIEDMEPILVKHGRLPEKE